MDICPFMRLLVSLEDLVGLVIYILNGLLQTDAVILASAAAVADRSFGVIAAGVASVFLPVAGSGCHQGTHGFCSFVYLGETDLAIRMACVIPMLIKALPPAMSSLFLI